jgi:hypothetical protein
MSADCWFIRVHEGIPKDMKAWSYMGNQVAELFSCFNGGAGIGKLVYEEHSFQVRRLTLDDWNMALTERMKDIHMDNEEMFLLDWSAPGEWFIVISW